MASTLTVEELEELEVKEGRNYEPASGGTGGVPAGSEELRYGVPELVRMEGGEKIKSSYGSYSVPQDIAAAKAALSKLTEQERKARIRYERWAQKRATKDISIFARQDPESKSKQREESPGSDGVGSDGVDGEEWSSTAWNSAFLEAQDMPETTPEQVLRKYRLLSKLSTDFIEIAKVYGRTVISEHNLPEDQQTVATIRIGGVAGGTKYIVRGILFKLAVDPAVGFNPRTGQRHYVYGGKHPSYEFAAKAAGHELKGAINMYKYGKLGITVPMQALVDFHGYRLVAMPLLPLKGGKLIYGSKDTGETIHHDDEKFNQWMIQIAGDLHLAGHDVCDREGVPHHIYSAGDVEGHRGSDGRYYLIDLARAFPPESRADTHHLTKHKQAVFFRMIRPEFLQWLKKHHPPNEPDKKFPPLSCDALTLWAQSGRDTKKHNDAIREATKILIHKVIPEFASFFVQKTPRQLRDVQVSEELHRHGINVRHMGLVRFMITGADESSLAARRTLLINMVSRTLKNLLRREMRLEHNRHKRSQTSDHDSRSMVVDFLNLVTRADPDDQKTSDFWSEIVPFGLMKRFGQTALSQQEQENLFSFIKDDVVKIVKYVVSTTGVRVRPAAMRTLETTGAGFEFVSVDLDALAVRIKHMSIIDYATAKVLSQEAYQGRVGTAGDRLLSLARRQFNRTLQSNPLDAVCKSEAQVTKLRINARKYENKTKIASVEMRAKARYYMLADESILAACSVAARQSRAGSGSDSDELANMIRSVLTTWGARRRGKYADLFPRCGGASQLQYITQLIKFVEKTRNRLLTLELCAYLATCKEPRLTMRLHHYIKEITVKEEKDIASQGIPPMQVKSGKKKGPMAPIPIDEHLITGLVEKLTKKENPTARTLVVVSNLLAATESPELWLEASKIAGSLAKVNRDSFFRWYASTPWNLRRGEAGGPLSDREAECISEVVKALSPLSILDLRGLRMEAKHVERIAAACSSLPKGTVFTTLKSNHSLPVQQLRANDLTELDFSQMASHDLVWLFALLRHNKSVRKISIAHTDISMLEVKAICDGLCNDSVNEIRFQACDIGDNEMAALGAALSRLPRLQVVSLRGNTFSDAGGRIIGQMKRLRELDISECKAVTDRTLAEIAKHCKELESLRLAQCYGVSDDGATHIARIGSLRTLDLEECNRVSDRGIGAVARGCPKLTALSVANCTRLSGGSLLALAKYCKGLEEINLCFCSEIQDNPVATLVQGCSKLRRIALGHCDKLTDKSVAQIGIRCTKLEALDVSVCEKVTDESIKYIAKGCHQLKELNIGVCEKVTNHAIAAVAEHCRELEVLNISCCDKITDEAITKLAKCAELRSLNLYSCKHITDAGLKELAGKCKKLRHLDLFWCVGIKESAIEQLIKNNPECQIER